MYNNMIYSKNIWGPKAWHLLHIFSINNDSKISESKKHNYFIFYKSFTYLIPCIICSNHYGNIINSLNPLIKEKINRKYLIKWVYKTHNIVNKITKKPKYEYNKFLESIKNIEINHNDIFFIFNAMYLEIDYDNISLYKYDQIYNFFINFCLLYPDKKKRKVLKSIINNDDFKKIITPKQFINMFKNKIDFIKKTLIK